MTMYRELFRGRTTRYINKNAWGTNNIGLGIDLLEYIIGSRLIIRQPPWRADVFTDSDWASKIFCFILFKINISHTVRKMNGKQGNSFEHMESVDDASKDYNKDLLAGYIQHLRCRVEELESYQLIAKRVEIMKRSHYKSLQSNRRESIGISGIPDTVRDKELENKTLEILDSIVVGKVEPW